MSRAITVHVSDNVFALLKVLGASEAIAAKPGEPDDVVVQAVVETLIDHAQQGVYRPGSWERGWLHQAFGDAWEQLLEWDDRPFRCAGDGRVIFQRPRRA